MPYNRPTWLPLMCFLCEISKQQRQKRKKRIFFKHLIGLRDFKAIFFEQFDAVEMP